MSNRKEIKRLMSQFLNGIALAVISSTIVLPAVNGSVQLGPVIVGAAVVVLCLLSVLTLWLRG